jgi:hypothetical protein
LWPTSKFNGAFATSTNLKKEEIPRRRRRKKWKKKEEIKRIWKYNTIQNKMGIHIQHNYVAYSLLYLLFIEYPILFSFCRVHP